MIQPYHRQGRPLNDAKLIELAERRATDLPVKAKKA
jgi:hypothetical protein